MGERNGRNEVGRRCVGLCVGGTVQPEFEHFTAVFLTEQVAASQFS